MIDTHNDVTQRLVVEGIDLATRLPNGQTDLPRMRQGGLDAEFLSVWVPPELYPKERAYTQALAQFDAIDRMVAANAGSVMLARNFADVRRASADGKTAFLIGVEGGHALGDAPDAELLRRLRQFYDKGARYMTLTWSNSNRLGGSSGDTGKSTCVLAATTTASQLHPRASTTSRNFRLSLRSFCDAASARAT